jgi:hypothetical protein
MTKTNIPNPYRYKTIHNDDYIRITHLPCELYIDELFEMFIDLNSYRDSIFPYNSIVYSSYKSKVSGEIIKYP